MATLLIIFALLGVESFVGLVAQLPDIGKNHYTLWTALHYVLLLDPFVLYQFFPMACLLGGLLGLGGLASTHELLAMRASGISIAQVMIATVKAALMMLVFVVIIGEGVAPGWVNKATLLKQKAMGQDANEDTFQGVWLKQGENFVHVDAIVSDTHIVGVTQYLFDEAHQLQFIVNSREGTLNDGEWKLSDSNKTIFSEQAVTVEPIENQSLKMKIKRNLIALTNSAPDQESVFNLHRSYSYRRQAGLSYVSLELAFWQRLFQPLTVMVMICLGVPFIFGSLREAGMGTRLLTGGILGFGFYILNQFVGRFSIAIEWPPIVAALFPTAVFALVCLILLRRVES